MIVILYIINYVRFELPQAFFMRVAMGLAIQEKDKERNEQLNFINCFPPLII